MKRTTTIVIVSAAILTLLIGIMVGGMAGGAKRNAGLGWTPPASISMSASPTPVASPVDSAS